MKHRKMLISAIILIACGVILWLFVSPIVMYFGVGSYETGWWIFSETHYYATPLYWVGLGLWITGLSLLTIGIILLPIVAILEYTDKKKVETIV